MKWFASLDRSLVILLVALAVVAVLVLLKRATLVPTDKASALLAQGGVVVDVRTASEFASGHLPGAANIPVDELAARIATAVPDKSTPVLVQCLSSTRSAMACRILRGMGYAEVVNLGSLARARRIVGAGERR